MEPGTLLGIGNPLLDLTVVGDENLLKKYNLEADNAVLANEEQKDIYKDLLDNYEVQFLAGGSVQNSLRVCQWVLKKPKICVFMGSVGRDTYSQILEKTAQDDGVDAKYQYQINYPTGTCAVIITTHQGNKRSLCANLAAAEKFTVDHILKPENYQYVEKAKVFYISGFFLTVSPETVLKVGEHASMTNKIFVANLSAPFVCISYKDSLMKVLPYTDILFGNKTEALSFGEGTFQTRNIEEIAQKIASLPKINEKRQRVVIITQGSQPVIYVEDNIVKEMHVPNLPKEKIIDTNGAGDAFVGGFLSQLISGRSIDECIKCGVWAAAHIIQHSGCSFDNNVNFLG